MHSGAAHEPADAPHGRAAAQAVDVNAAGMRSTSGLPCPSGPPQTNFKCLPSCVVNDDWARAMGLPSKAEHTAARVAALKNPVTHACPTANIDVWMITRQTDMAPASILLRSLDLFMPCRGETHVVVDEEDLPKMLGWIWSLRPPKTYPFRIPCSLAEVPGYIMQAWLMLHADRFLGPNADYIMWLDSDALLGMPVTCGSLFDPAGLVYQVSWPIISHGQFRESCEYVFRRPCLRSYMATFPFTMPRDSMPRFRAHLAQKIGEQNGRSPSRRQSFDEAFKQYVDHGNHLHLSGQTKGWLIMGMSQFVWMGEYMRTEEPGAVRQAACARWGTDRRSRDASTCFNYAPPGLHMSWGNCLYTGAPGCAATKWFSTPQQHNASKKAGYDHSKKFGSTYIRAANEIMWHGYCLKHRLMHLSMPTGCPTMGPLRPHEEVMIYGHHAFDNGWAQANLSDVMSSYVLDPPNDGSCHAKADRYRGGATDGGNGGGSGTAPAPTAALPLPRTWRPTSCSRNVTRVLITGISGMIGSHIARVLVDAECTTVYGLVRPRTDLSALQGILQRVELVKGDIADAVGMRRLIESLQPHYIYHMAAQAINGISTIIPDLTLDVNVRGTLNLLEPVRDSVRTWALARGVPCRVLFAGSSTEYGRTADDKNGAALPEDAVLSPVTPYGLSKLAGENLANQYHMAYNVSVVTARFFIQVGVGGTDSLAIHEFCKQIALAEQGLGPAVVLHGNLDTSRDMTDASDSAPVIVALAERGVTGEAYNIGSGRTMTVLDLLQTALRLARVRVEARVDADRFRAYDEKVLLADNAKVRALTGWVPSTNMTVTVHRILDYWRRKVATVYAPLDAPGPSLAKAMPEQSARLAAAVEGGGASGTLFRARRVREYRGERLFTNPVASVTKANGAAAAEDAHGARRCVNWAVCTTINEPTDAVRSVAQLRGWCLVVVGDRKGPATYPLTHGVSSRAGHHGGSVMYLTPANQDALQYRILEHLPWNHFGRKNVGYLFAISHGAERIFDFDDDNMLLCLGHHAIPLLHVHQPTLIHEVESEEPVYNLYAQMVSSNTTTWPRGFPLDRVRDASTNSAVWRSGVGRRVGILQSLADVDPDVDAIYRLVGGALPFYFRGQRSPLRRVESPDLPAAETPALRAFAAKPLRLEQLTDCKEQEDLADSASTGKSRGTTPGLGAPVGLRPGTMMPYNAQACLHFYDAMWGMLLPSTVHGRVSDIWRGYMAQRLMWNLNLTIAFSAPWVAQYRNVHTALADLAAEQPLYRQSGELISALRRWTPTTSTLPGQIEELYIHLFELDILEERDVLLAQAWLHDLLRLGYEFPAPLRNRL